MFDPAVVTIAKITAGTTDNVIPEQAEMLGTMRPLSEQTRAAVKEKLHRVAPPSRRRRRHRGGADPAGLPGHRERRRRRRPGALDAAGAARPGPGRLAKDPIMGAEDFSYVLQRVPGRCPGSAPARRAGPGGRAVQPLQPGRLRRGRDGRRRRHPRRHRPGRPRRERHRRREPRPGRPGSRCGTGPVQLADRPGPTATPGPGPRTDDGGPASGSHRDAARGSGVAAGVAGVGARSRR